MAIGREQVLAFRLASHGLHGRTKGLVEAAARCGIQETPLGTAALAFHARVDGLTAEKLEKALSKDRTLLALWAMRGAPHVVPATDLEVFTTGALPLDRRIIPSNAWVAGRRRLTRRGWIPSR